MRLVPPLTVARLTDNKFSSFVRQLNFYGFRKVKSNIAVDGHDSRWWEFKVRSRLLSIAARRVSWFTHLRGGPSRHLKRRHRGHEVFFHLVTPRTSSTMTNRKHGWRILAKELAWVDTAVGVMARGMPYGSNCSCDSDQTGRAEFSRDETGLNGTFCRAAPSPSCVWH